MCFFLPLPSCLESEDAAFAQACFLEEPGWLTIHVLCGYVGIHHADNAMLNPFFELVTGNSPVVGVALHSGDAMRSDLLPYIKLAEADRLREEDPYTDSWANIVDNKIIVHKSRFEVDLNRPRNGAIYNKPEDAWGLQVWKQELPAAIIAQSLHFYDYFYRSVGNMLRKVHDRFGFIIVLDIHSYNHRRNGPQGPEADLSQNPDINIGTSNMHRERWSPVVEGFMKDLRQCKILGKELDVRENIKFKGGYFSQWVHSTFLGSSCSIAVEFKKIFMDEWSGNLYNNVHQALKSALFEAMPGLIKNSKKILEHA